jgi:CRP-like cAMP-binding protein
MIDAQHRGLLFDIQGDVETIEKLKKIPLFADLGDASLAHVAKLADEVEIPSGLVLMQPKEPGSGLFIIEEGTALVELPGGKKIELGPGECFGELALLDDRSHTGRVRTKTEMRALAIRRSDFQELLETEPRIAISLLRMLAHRLATSTAAPAGKT